ncbi:MAG: uroporphyrinogen-III synthase [Planctomycetaceae bacterium]|nr:uroporphyrinogen-III synthase [Planctomycetaceae bacterium]
MSQTIRVCSFESRRNEEMTSLIERFGGVPTVVRSMQEIPLEENAEVFEFGKQLLANEFDLVLFLTGVGAKALFEILELKHSVEEIREAFNACQIMVRGPKPIPVLRDYGIRVDLKAPEPNTWREVISELERNEVELSGKRFAIQEYGVASTELREALESRGASVSSVSVYRWALPDDVGPLEQAIRDTIRGEFDVLLITSAQQINNILEVADSLGLKDQWLQAASKCIIGSIGPTASERIREFGLPVSMEPSHPKMAHLAKEVIEFAQGQAETSQ